MSTARVAKQIEKIGAKPTETTPLKPASKRPSTTLDVVSINNSDADSATPAPAPAEEESCMKKDVDLSCCGCDCVCSRCCLSTIGLTIFGAALTGGSAGYIGLEWLIHGSSAGMTAVQNTALLCGGMTAIGVTACVCTVNATSPTRRC